MRRVHPQIDMRTVLEFRCGSWQWPMILAVGTVLLASNAGFAHPQRPLETRLAERWRWRVIPPPDNAEYTTRIREWNGDQLIAAHDKGLSVFDGYAWTPVPNSERLNATLQPDSILRVSSGILVASRNQLQLLEGDRSLTSLIDTEANIDLSLPAVGPDGRTLVTNGKQIFEVSRAALEPGVAPPSPEATIQAIGYDSSGRLWCSTTSGIFRRDDDGWTQLHTLAGPPVRINRIIAAGSLVYFLATDTLEESLVWDGQNMMPMRGSAAPLGAWDAVGMPDGELVVAGTNGLLCVYRAGEWHAVASITLTEKRNRSLVVLDGNRLSVLTGSGRLLVCDFESDRWADFDPTTVGVSGVINAIAPAAAGGYWIGTDHGIARFDGETFRDVHFQADEAALTGITAVQEDTNGDLWVGTGWGFSGARRWDGTRWYTHDEPNGIGDRKAHVIRRGPDGAMWFALFGDPPSNDQSGGIARYRDGEWKAWDTTDGLPSARCYDIAFAPDGTVYAAAYNGVARLVEDRWEPLPAISRERLHAFAIIVAPNGALWLGRGLQDRGIFRFFDGKWTEMRGRDWNGAGAAAFALSPDGYVWFASESGLGMADGARVDRVSDEDGSLSRNYWPVLCDQDGTIWAGSRGGGLIRYRPDDDDPPRADHLETVGPVEEGHVDIRWNGRDFWNNTPGDRIRYRITVDGEHASDVDGDTRANLRPLSAGPHIVEVSATDLWGNTDPSPARLAISVQPASIGPSPTVIGGIVLLIVGTTAIFLYSRAIETRRRRRSERERRRLQASEEHFRTLVEGAEVILARFDADSRLTYVSPQIDELSGVSPSELIARGGMPKEKIHPDDFWLVEQMRRARAAGDTAPHEAEFRVSDAKGNWIWFLYCQRARTSADGSIEGYDVAILETTVRKEQEAAVRRERDFLFRLLEVAGSQLTELGDFSAHVANAMADALETPVACVSLLEGETVRVLALWDHGELRRDIRFPIEGSPVAQIKSSGAPCTLRGALVEQFPNDPCIVRGNIRCLIGVPMISPSGKLIGVVAVMSDQDRGASPAEITRLRLFGQFAGAFIERHQAEAELQESERALHTLMSNLPGMAYRCRNDQNWTMEFVSEGCRELCGYDAGDLTLNRTVAYNDLIHPDDQQKVWDDVQAAVEQRQPFELVYRVRTATGIERWVWEQGRGVYAADGTLLALEGFITDISELRRAEAIQAGQRDVLEHIATGASMPAVLDRLIHAVEALSEGMLGSVLLLDEDGTHLRHASAPSLPNSYSQAINGAPIGPAVGSCGTAAYRKERVVVVDILSDPLWADYRELAAAHGLRACWSEPILSGKGEVLGTFAMYYREPRAPSQADIQLIEQAAALAGIAIERTRAELALRRERDFNRSLVRESPTFFVAIDRTGKVILMNDAMLRALGYTADEVVGKDYLSTFVPEPDRAALTKIFDSLIAGTGRSVNENRVRSKDGRELLVEWHGSTVFDEIGEPSYFFGVGIDITERRRLEEKMLQTQKMETVGRLAAGVAHDFNNLLTALHAHLAAVRDRMPADHPAADSLGRSEQVAEQCTILVRSLLMFTRQLPVRREPVDFNEIVRRSLRLLEPVVPDGIAVSLQLDDDVPPVVADAAQIQQIVMNLCMNARDAMPAGGQLDIRTSRSELPAPEGSTNGPTMPAVELTVGDTGCGMDEATRERAFEPFFTTKEGGRGTGLGLSIVYGIINEHGGRIHIATQPKLGTIVRVRLAAVGRLKKTDRRVASPDEPPVPPPPRPLTVLFADDETELLEANASVLEANGISVVRAETGTDALRLFETTPSRFDVVMLDHKMPGMNGLDCAKRIAAVAPDTPILMTTGFVTAEVASLQDSETRFTILQKPFRPQTLLDRVRELAESRKPV